MIKKEKHEVLSPEAARMCYRVVAPCVASRGNRLLAFLPTPLFSPLLSPSLPGSPRLWKCSNPLVSVWIPLSWTEQLKTLLLAGLGKEKAVCTAHSLRRAPSTALSVDKKESEREQLWDWERESGHTSERATEQMCNRGNREKEQGRLPIGVIEPRTK